MSSGFLRFFFEFIFVWLVYIRWTQVVASVLGFITPEPDDKQGDYCHWMTLI